MKLVIEVPEGLCYFMTHPNGKTYPYGSLDALLLAIRKFCEEYEEAGVVEEK